MSLSSHVEIFESKRLNVHVKISMPILTATDRRNQLSGSRERENENRWMGACMPAWMDASCMHAGLDGQTDRWLDGHTDGQTDKYD